MVKYVERDGAEFDDDTHDWTCKLFSNEFL